MAHYVTLMRWTTQGYAGLPKWRERLEEGVELEDGRTAPVRARLLGPSTIELVLHEGRKHQVKRMCEAVGHPVQRLHRSAYAGLTVEGLEPGAWRELEPLEVEQLRSVTASPRAGRRRRAAPGPG